MAGSTFCAMRYLEMPVTTGESLSANYKRAFGKRIGFGARPALIMIDFVQAYFDPACALYAGVEDALASAFRLQSAARAAACL